MNKRPRKLPKFRSREEEARFWDRHSVADYWDQLESVDELLVLAPELRAKIEERAKKRLLSIRLERWQIDQARRIAQRRHQPYQALLRRWITEGIRRERA